MEEVDISGAPVGQSQFGAHGPLTLERERAVGRRNEVAGDAWDESEHALGRGIDDQRHTPAAFRHEAVIDVVREPPTAQRPDPLARLL